MQETQTPNYESERASTPENPIVDGASSISDPAHNSSGPTAYIIFAVALLFIVGIANSLVSCSSRLFDQVGHIVTQELTDEYGEDFLDLDDFYDDNLPDSFWDFYYGDEELGQGHGLGDDGSLHGLDEGKPDSSTSPDTTAPSNDNNASGLNTEDALSRSYGFETTTLRSEVDRMLDDTPLEGDAQQSVQSYVDELCRIDETSTKELHELLVEAAKPGAQTHRVLEQAEALCDRTEDAIEDLPIPQDISGDDATIISTSLRGAQSSACVRWDQLDELIDTIDDPSPWQSSDSLDYIDSYIESSTVLSAQELYNALFYSAHKS